MAVHRRVITADSGAIFFIRTEQYNARRRAADGIALAF